MFLFPFGDVEQGSIIGIYGAGRVGASYARQIQETGYCKVGCVIDKKDLVIQGIWTQRISDVDINGVDCIVIAIEDDQVAREVENTFREKGASPRLIHHIVHYNGAYDHEHIREISAFSLTTIHSDTASVPVLSDKQKDEYREIKEALMIRRLENEELIRVGGHGDGGYLLYPIFGDKKIAYSIGIGDNIKWDEDMAVLGFDVFMYDHTVSHDELIGNEKLHFFRKGLSAEESEDELFDTLGRLIKLNGHGHFTDIVLKIDIEGAEWDILDKLTEEILNRFSQIIIELHNLLKMEKWGIYSKVLKKINYSHQAVHVHGNNACSYAVVDGQRFPDALEVTYINRKGRSFSNKCVRLPHELDEGNVDYFDEIVLDDWNISIVTE